MWEGFPNPCPQDGIVCLSLDTSLMLMNISSTVPSKALWGDFWDLHYSSVNFNCTDSDVWVLYVQSFTDSLITCSAPLSVFKSVCCASGWSIFPPRILSLITLACWNVPVFLPTVQVETLIRESHLSLFSSRYRNLKSEVVSGHCWKIIL